VFQVTQPKCPREIGTISLSLFLYFSFNARSSHLVVWLLDRFRPVLDGPDGDSAAVTGVLTTAAGIPSAVAVGEAALVGETSSTTGVVSSGEFMVVETAGTFMRDKTL
jgi:hypothetical protein